MPVKFFTAIHKHFTFGSHIFSFTSMTTCAFLVGYMCNVHMYYAFGNHIYSLFGRHILSTVFISIILGHISHMYNVHEVLSWQPQILHISRPYLFPHIYDPFSIPCLAVIFGFLELDTRFLLQFIIILIWEPYFPLISLCYGNVMHYNSTM